MFNEYSDRTSLLFSTVHLEMMFPRYRYEESLDNGSIPDTMSYDEWLLIFAVKAGRLFMQLVEEHAKANKFIVVRDTYSDTDKSDDTTMGIYFYEDFGIEKIIAEHAKHPQSIGVTVYTQGDDLWIDYELDCDETVGVLIREVPDGIDLKTMYDVISDDGMGFDDLYTYTKPVGKLVCDALDHIVDLPYYDE